MGLMHEAKKQGLLPEKVPSRRSLHPHLSGLVIESAEGVRFAHTATTLPQEALPEVMMIESEPEQTATPNG